VVTSPLSPGTHKGPSTLPPHPVPLQVAWPLPNSSVRHPVAWCGPSEMEWHVVRLGGVGPLWVPGAEPPQMGQGEN